MKKLSAVFFLTFIVTLLPFMSTSAYTIKDGGLVKGPDTTAVYYTINGGRYAFPTQKTFELYFGTDFWKVELINAAELANIPLKGTVLLPDNSLIKIQSIPKVYKVSTVNGVKALTWIETEQDAINEFGSNWAKLVIDISDVYFIDYQSNKPAIEMKDYYGSSGNPNNSTSNTASVSNDIKCQNSYGSNSYFTGNFSSTGNIICDCISGYTWNSNRTSCISYNQRCQDKYGINSYSKNIESDGTFTCGCKDGYTLNSDKTSCISNDEYCKITYGADHYYKADQNICAKTATTTQPSTPSTSTCDQYRARYTLLSTDVNYSDPAYFAERNNLATYLNQYCGGSYTQLPPVGSTSSKIYLGYSGASGTCSTNSIGYTTCNYSDGSSITSHTDSIGYTYLNYSNGLSGTCSTNSIGYTTCNYSNGTNVTCNTNSIGYTTCNYSDGSSITCHVDSLGYLSCY